VVENGPRANATIDPPLVKLNRELCNNNLEDDLVKTAGVDSTDEKVESKKESFGINGRYVLSIQPQVF
jgi:hypothetical protein